MGTILSLEEHEPYLLAMLSLLDYHSSPTYSLYFSYPLMIYGYPLVYYGFIISGYIFLILCHFIQGVSPERGERCIYSARHNQLTIILNTLHCDNLLNRIIQ